MNELPPPEDERDFFFVVKFSTALGFGCMAAFLYSLKQVHPDLSFRFTLGTVLVFLVVAVSSWIFCGVLAKSESGGDQPVRRNRFMLRWLVWFFGFASLGTVAAFAYALKDVNSESRRDVIEGTVIAIAVLSLGGVLIWKAFKFFEEQSDAELAARSEQDKDEGED
jgi:hypothetical protein